MKSRALGSVRLSNKTDETTSPERQKEAISRKADISDTVVIGIAEDLNVSASKVGPFERPQLGKWLKHRMDEFDTLIFWKLDRAARSMRDFSKLLDWVQENKKRLLFCEGTESTYEFDFRAGRGGGENSIQRILAMIISWAAEMEANNIRDRVRSSQSYLRKNGEWSGGVVPFGFIPEAKPRRGWKLVHCDKPLNLKFITPEAAERTVRLEPTMPVLREIVDRVLGGERLLPICNDLNKRNVPTPRDWWEIYKGREPKGRRWMNQTLRQLLENRALLGEWWHGDSRVVDDNGEPVERGEPAVTVSEFDKIQEVLKEFSLSKRVSFEDPNPLLGVAFCARCGLEYYTREDKINGYGYKSLTCRSKHDTRFESCKQPVVSLLYTTHVAESVVLSLIGSEEVKSRRFVPGDDRSEEQNHLKLRIEQLEDEWDSTPGGDFKRYMKRKKRIQDQLDAIGSDAVRPARYEWTGTGQTYSEVWSSLDVAGRLKLMTDLGLRIYFGRGESPAAEQAWRHQIEDIPELPISVRLSAYFSETDVGNILTGVNDGIRIRKNFKAWVIQSSEGFPHEILDASSSK